METVKVENLDISSLGKFSSCGQANFFKLLLSLGINISNVERFLSNDEKIIVQKEMKKRNLYFVYPEPPIPNISISQLAKCAYCDGNKYGEINFINLLQSIGITCVDKKRILSFNEKYKLWPKIETLNISFSQNSHSPDIRLGFLVQNFNILIDTCSLKEDASIIFFQDLLNEVSKYRNKYIYITRKVNTEIIEQIRKQDNYIINECYRLLNISGRLRIKEEVASNPYPVNGDESIINIIERVVQTNNNNYMLITQDSGLAIRFMNIYPKCSNKLRVYKINQSGHLKEHAIPKPVQPINLGVNDIVYYNYMKSTLQLAEPVKILPRATIYKTTIRQDGRVYFAKIYKTYDDTNYKKSKYSYMCKFHVNNVCFPIKSLQTLTNNYGSRGDVGYSLDVFEGDTLTDVLKNIKNVINYNENNKYSSWDTKKLVSLCINLVRTINQINQNGIFIGNINPDNIIVKTPDDYKFINTDYYQVYNGNDKLPCDDLNNNSLFVEPNISRLSINQIPTIHQDEENFAIAILIFYVLHLGVHPYTSFSNTRNIFDNLRNSYFEISYIGKSEIGHIWTSLNREIQQAFKETFFKGDIHNNTKKCYSANQWITMLESYLRYLSNRRIVVQSNPRVTPKSSNDNQNKKRGKKNVNNNNQQIPMPTPHVLDDINLKDEVQSKEPKPIPEKPIVDPFIW